MPSANNTIKDKITIAVHVTKFKSTAMIVQTEYNIK